MELGIHKALKMPRESMWVRIPSSAPGGREYLRDSFEKLLRIIFAASTSPLMKRNFTKEDKKMLNKLWFRTIRAKARIKEAMGFKLTPWEDFIIEIGLY